MPRRSSCRSGSIANGGTGAGLFAGPDPDFESGPVQTFRVCDKLHIAVVTLEIVVPQLLPPGQTFSYNVTIVTSHGTNDLKSLGLLRDNLFDAHSKMAGVTFKVVFWELGVKTADELSLVREQLSPAHLVEVKALLPTYSWIFFIMTSRHA